MREEQLNSNSNGLSWKDLLENYINTNYNESECEKQEKESYKEMMSYFNIENESQTIPKFFFKKPMFYNDLYFSVKSEAKSRFLSNRSYDIPIKQSIEF